MMKLLFTLSFLVFFISCSFVKKPNEWERKSSMSFASYVDAFLSADDYIAQNSLNRAIKHAKQSSDLDSLAKIYLGECALKSAVGIQTACEKYLSLRELLDSKELEAYYAFLEGTILSEQLTYLPRQYKPFAMSYGAGEYEVAKKRLFEIENAASFFIAAQMMREYLDAKDREKILNRASENGYKKAILFWLDESKKRSSIKSEIDQIEKKISILNSQE